MATTAIRTNAQIKKKRGLTDMRKNENQALLDTIEARGWWYEVYDDGLIEIGQPSPAGEDFFFDIEGNDIALEVQDYSNYFDVDEHIEMWIRAKRAGTRGVPSARELVYDAEAIKKMLQELADALYNAERINDEK